MLAVGLVGAGLVAQQYLTAKHDDLRYEHTDGPFPATTSADGSIRLGATVQAFHRGDSFGWASSFCALPHAGLLLQARLVSLVDNEVLLYRERMVDADAMGCSASRWNIALPADMPPGRYQLQRFLLLTPKSAAPRIVHLPPLAVEVVP